MKKQFVSLDEALNFLQFINTDKQAFTNTSFDASALKQQKGRKSAKRIMQIKQKKLPLVSMAIPQGGFGAMDQNDNMEGANRKLINKNRAIKRIIETSKQILEENYRWQEPPPDQKKSHVTQFNIYLKQYNRLSQQIMAQQEKRGQQQTNYVDQQQHILENVYLYTVCEDFRQLLYVSVLKDKINKTNIDLVMETFKECLIILKSNELKIHQYTTEDSPHRDIKLHQIENVDYFSQPYIFTVMTIIKDKSSGPEYLCFRFDSHERQHKWDRAVYCNYITKKMKRKNKYFLYEFPEKQDQKQNNEGREHLIKKRDDIKSYEIDRKKIIKNITIQKEKQKDQTRMGTQGMDTDRDLPTTQKRGVFERFNTENQIKLMIPSNQGSPYLLTTKNADQKPFFQTNIKGMPKRKQEGNEATQSKQDDKKQEKLKKDSMGQSKHNSVHAQIANINQSGFGQKKISDNQIRQNLINIENIFNFNKVESQLQFQEEKNSKKSAQSRINIETKRKIELRQKHKNGITVKKPKFFNDKPKIIYLGNEELEYWDFDQKTMHKFEKKLILFKDLQNWQVKQKGSIVFQLSNKTLQFLGKPQALQQIVQWIQINKKEKQAKKQQPLNNGDMKRSTKQNPNFIL